MAGTMRKGNWLEEAALEKYTGIKSFNPNIPAHGAMTYKRCIEHTDRLNTKDYESVMASCIKDPKLHPQAKTLKDKVGPRFALQEARMRAQVESTVSATQSLAYTENRKVEYLSDSMRNYNKPGFKPSLKEDLDLRRQPTHSANYVTDAAITYYSAAVEQNPRACPFPTSFIVSANPFRKSAAYSTTAEISGGAFRSESNERPRPFPTVLEYSSVKSLRKRLIKHVSAVYGVPLGTGKVINKVVETLWGLVSSSVPQVDMDSLAAGLQADLGFVMNADESKGVLRTFNADGTSFISLPEFTDYMRDSLKPRALELVDRILASITANDAGVVKYADVRAVYKGREEIYVNKTGSGMTKDDLYEYFVDCAAELEDAEAVERMLCLWL